MMVLLYFIIIKRRVMKRIIVALALLALGCPAFSQSIAPKVEAASAIAIALKKFQPEGDQFFAGINVKLAVGADLNKGRRSLDELKPYDADKFYWRVHISVKHTGGRASSFGYLATIDPDSGAILN